MTLVGLILVTRFMAGWRSAQSVEPVLGVTAMVMTLYALVLAFVVVNLYSDYSTASGDVTDEANALDALVQDARAFSGEARVSIDRAVGAYITEVRGREFAMLSDGHRDPRAERLVGGIVDAVQAYSPRTATEAAFYRAAADQLNVFVGERENRIAKAHTSIPPPLLVLLLFLAAMTLAVSLLIRTHRAGVDAALVVVIAVVVGAGLLTALILQYPYSGSIAVTSDAFTRGALAQLAAPAR